MGLRPKFVALRFLFRATSPRALRGARIEEYSHFLTIAVGSLAELETQLLICNRLGYCEVDVLIEQVNRVRALVLGIRNKQAAN
jgi:four helix bundle protein